MVILSTLHGGARPKQFHKNPVIKQTMSYSLITFLIKKILLYCIIGEFSGLDILILELNGEGSMINGDTLSSFFFV